MILLSTEESYSFAIIPLKIATIILHYIYEKLVCLVYLTLIFKPEKVIEQFVVELILPFSHTSPTKPGAQAHMNLPFLFPG